MAIKKKISELPESTNFAGLWTIGVDALNRSVKVSLQYIATKFSELTETINGVIKSAGDATKSANSAASSANSAATKANTAATSADTAKANADKATTNANTATESANKAAEAANTAAETATNAASSADAATKDANEAATKVNTAVEAANTATESANKAAEDCMEIIDAAQQTGSMNLVPTSMEIEYPEHITLGNLAELFINAELSPASVVNNILFLGDGKAVEVTPDGRLTAKAKGISTLHIIPTANTALYRSIQIVVGNPTLRFASTRASLRLTSAGGLRLT